MGEAYVDVLILSCNGRHSHWLKVYGNSYLMTVVSIKQDSGCEGLPWQFSAYKHCASTAGDAGSQFLIWELRHCMPARAAKKKKN